LCKLVGDAPKFPTFYHWASQLQFFNTKKSEPPTFDVVIAQTSR
jgi:hypothetical protein